MADVGFVALAVALFAVSAGYVEACRRMVGGADAEDRAGERR